MLPGGDMTQFALAVANDRISKPRLPGQDRKQIFTAAGQELQKTAERAETPPRLTPDSWTGVPTRKRRSEYSGVAGQ